MIATATIIAITAIVNKISKRTKTRAYSCSQHFTHNRDRNCKRERTIVVLADPD